MRWTLHDTIMSLRRQLSREPRGAAQTTTRKGTRPSLDVAVRALRDSDTELLGMPRQDPQTRRTLIDYYR